VQVLLSILIDNEYANKGLLHALLSAKKIMASAPAGAWPLPGNSESGAAGAPLAPVTAAKTRKHP